MRDSEARDARRTDGKCRSRVLGVPKLEDAILAGTARSKECTLILTEGDSAKSLAVAGFAVIGRERYGVFALCGKLLNPRDLPLAKVMENKEVQSLKRILGLETGREYTEAREGLRYGRVLLMCDADLDGYHIKGLAMNLFHTLWPSLLRIEGFLSCLLTPIVRVSRGGGGESLKFYTQSEFEEWRRRQR
jgi:DNA topoisomerase-2